MERQQSITLPPELSAGEIDSMTLSELTEAMGETLNTTKSLARANALMQKRMIALTNAMHLLTEAEDPKWEEVARAALAVVDEEMEVKRRAQEALTSADESEAMTVRPPIALFG